jgi:hypothetical protein
MKLTTLEKIIYLFRQKSKSEDLAIFVCVEIKRTNKIDWSSKINSQFNNGRGEFWFKAVDIETVTIIVRQLSGDTPLEETRIIFIILRERAQ